MPLGNTLNPVLISAFGAYSDVTSNILLSAFNESMENLAGSDSGAWRNQSNPNWGPGGSESYSQGCIIL